MIIYRTNLYGIASHADRVRRLKKDQELNLIFRKLIKNEKADFYRDLRRKQDNRSLSSVNKYNDYLIGKENGDLDAILEDRDIGHGVIKSLRKDGITTVASPKVSAPITLSYLDGAKRKVKGILLPKVSGSDAAHEAGHAYDHLEARNEKDLVDFRKHFNGKKFEDQLKQGDAVNLRNPNEILDYSNYLLQYEKSGNRGQVMNAWLKSGIPTEELTKKKYTVNGKKASMLEHYHDEAKLGQDTYNSFIDYDPPNLNTGCSPEVWKKIQENLRKKNN